VARRDSDGAALSLVVVPPWEIRVERNERDRLRPTIFWNDRVMHREDMRQLTLMPDPDDPLRGAGPLQVCGAAISVSVESQQWAASFYAEGGYPSVYIRPDFPFPDEDAAEKARQKWVSTPHNTPRIVEEATIGTLPFNEAGAQMLASREYQTGEAARMFGIPGTLLDHAVAGSSLTYQNVGDEFDKFVRSCLWPNYLEPIEQEMSDLLTRSTIARFNLKALLRPDPKTRAEIHSLNITSGVYDADYARIEEGIDPGDIETAPVPLSPPAAIPTPIRFSVFRCPACDRKLAESVGPGTRIMCRCGTMAAA
jgi:HK97 family phage portal protein